MRDEMDEAHKRDTRLQNDLGVARAALMELALSAPANLAMDVIALAERLKKQEDRIVARWN